MDAKTQGPALAPLLAGMKTPALATLLAGLMADVNASEEARAQVLARLISDLWLPMSTAPKSGVDERGAVRAIQVLGFCPLDEDDGYTEHDDAQIGIEVVWWEPKLDGGCWYNGLYAVEPTRWLPLPLAPQPALLQSRAAPETPVSAPSAAAAAIGG